MWTRRVGNGPIVVARSERLPLIVPERHQRCEYCGKETVVSWLQVGHDRFDWPVPAIPPGFDQVDEQVEPEPEPPSLEQRVAQLEARS